VDYLIGGANGFESRVLPCISSARSILRPCWATAVRLMAYSLSHLAFIWMDLFMVSMSRSSASWRTISASWAARLCRADEKPILLSILPIWVPALCDMIWYIGGIIQNGCFIVVPDLKSSGFFRGESGITQETQEKT